MRKFKRLEVSSEEWNQMVLDILKTLNDKKNFLAVYDIVYNGVVQILIEADNLPMDAITKLSWILRFIHEKRPNNIDSIIHTVKKHDFVTRCIELSTNPESKLELVHCIGYLCAYNKEIRQHVRSSTFPAFLVEKIATAQLSANIMCHLSFTWANLMEDNDVDFDQIVPNQEILFHAFEILLSPAKNQITKVINCFEIIPTYFCHEVPQRFERLLIDEKIINLLWFYVSENGVDGNQTFMALKCFVTLIQNGPPNCFDSYLLGNGLIKKLEAAWTKMDLKSQLIILKGFIITSKEITLALWKNGSKIIPTTVIKACYRHDEKNVELAVEIIILLIDILDESQIKELLHKNGGGKALNYAFLKWYFNESIFKHYRYFLTKAVV